MRFGRPRISNEASSILQEEGVSTFWKGHGTTVVHRIPYSSTDFFDSTGYKMAYFTHTGELNGNYVRSALDIEGKLQSLEVDVGARLLGGAAAGDTAATWTYPLDFDGPRFAAQEPVKAAGLVQLGYTQGTQEGFRPRSKRVMLPSAADSGLQPLAHNDDGNELKQRHSCTPPVDTAKARFPYCLVWTPLPVVAWLVPFVGHVGICREDGVILDFAGPFFVNVDNFAFGSTAKYLRLDTDKCCFPPRPSAHTCEDGVSHATLGTGISWDDALRLGTHNYQHKSYNLFTCNCHSFTASCMNRLAYNRSIRWNVVDIGVMVFWKGQWVSYAAVFRAFGPFVVVMAMGLLIAGWPFLIGWAAFSTLLLAWFLIATYFMNDVIHC